MDKAPMITVRYINVVDLISVALFIQDFLI